MAIVTQRIHGVNNDQITLRITFNDANGNIQSATVTNNHPTETAEYTVWLTADPTMQAVITVLPGTVNVYPNIPGNIRYSAIERAVGDPRAANFDYRFRSYV